MGEIPVYLGFERQRVAELVVISEPAIWLQSEGRKDQNGRVSISGYAGQFRTGSAAIQEDSRWQHQPPSGAIINPVKLNVHQ